MLNYCANGPSGYNLTNSLRFRQSASAYLNRTPASAGSRTTWTWSGWVKRGILGSAPQALLGAGTSNTIYDRISFENDQIRIVLNNGTGDITTTAVYRDPSSWYHVVVAFDTTQATASNRVKIYVNGTQVTSFSASTYPSQNYTTNINNNILTTIGALYAGSYGTYLDGYQTEINFIDGQALTPSSFGSTNSTTGVWQPAKYTGTYGTNGFYLNFSNIALTSGSNTGLGKDYSGNGNYWNTNNISVTSGVTYDAMTDVPTLTSATVANYAVWNSAIGTHGSTPNINAIISNANLTATDAGALSYNSGTSATMGVSSGKWYWENTVGSTSPTYACHGIAFQSGSDPTQYGISYDPYGSGGLIRSFANGSATTLQSSVGTPVANDVIGIALDCDAQTVKFYKNNVQVGTTVTYTSYLPTGYSFIYPGFWSPNQSGASISTTFGQRPFTYTPPTGYVALNTYNLPTSTIVQGNKYMNATTYTGTGGFQSITNAGSMQPDLLWIKSRSNAVNNVLIDSVRGNSLYLVSNSTAAEVNNGGPYILFNSDGFSVGADSQSGANGYTYVGWQWKANAGTNTTNTAGSITSTVSVNASAGFSIVTYTGTGSNATVGHGLGVAPKMVIIKNRTASATAWNVYQASIPSGNLLSLNSTAASFASTNRITAVSSTTFSIGADSDVNGSTNSHVAYCWAEISGFSAFGSYTGNGSSDGPFVYLGFRPKFVMVKKSSSTGSWAILDTARNPYNVTNTALYADLSNAENSIYEARDYLSNGFKLRITDQNSNQSGQTFIYMAFAENPFKNALAR